MRNKNYMFVLLSLIIILFFSTNTFSQENTENCRVLLHTISGTYEGGCKNGFANGKGIAQGVDKYEGKFKKGLPNGTGKYTWANGNIYEGEWKMGKRHGVGTLYSASNGESVKGYWKDDEFIKEIEDPGYRIINQYNIKSITIRKTSDEENSIVLKFIQDGQITNDMIGLDINVNNGILTKSNVFTYRLINCPWTCDIKFTAITKLSRQAFQCSVNYEITKKGSWEVIINY